MASDDRNGKRFLRLAPVIRWLHIYLSMLGFMALLFFSVTGLTLNHPDWFSDPEGQTRTETGEIDLAWLQSASPIPDEVRDDPDYDAAVEVRPLEIVEHLREQYALSGKATLEADEYECLVSFKGPGYFADVFIDRETGEYTLTETKFGGVAILNDLHKGRDTGEEWAWVIDVTAVLLSLVAVSGLLLLLYLKKRRRDGLVLALLATAALVAVYVVWVP